MSLNVRVVCYIAIDNKNTAKYNYAHADTRWERCDDSGVGAGGAHLSVTSNI